MAGLRSVWWDPSDDVGPERISEDDARDMARATRALEEQWRGAPDPERRPHRWERRYVPGFGMIEVDVGEA